MKISYKYLLLLFLPLLIGCSEGPINEQLAKKWDIPAATEGEFDGYYTFVYKKNGPNDFWENAGKGADTLKGNWTLGADSIMTLTYEVSNQVTGIDSVVFDVENNNPAVIFMEDGVEKSRMNSDGFVPVKRNAEIKLDSISDQHLRVIINDKKIVLQHNPVIEESNMSFVGIMRGLLGMLVLVALGWLASANRKAIDWWLVVKGLGFQIVFAILILKVPFIADGFDAISKGFISVIEFANDGAKFLFGSFVDNGRVDGALVNFVFTILPTIVFFSALTSMLYYFGILQKVVWVLAWVMKRLMKLSGAESLAAAGNIFLGQTEAPLLIKPYLKTMTKSEMMCLMAGGMATIAGGVLAAYIGFLGGDDPAQQLFFAKHLLAASVMSAPAAIVAAKMLVPETEPISEELVIPREKIGANVLEAIANGTTDGLKLAVNVAAMLLVFIGLMAMMNSIMHDGIGSWTGINDYLVGHGYPGGLNFETVLGWIFSPLAWTMGVPSEDIFLVGQLLGEKTILNEFVAYNTLGNMKAAGSFAHDKSIIMATYVLCGFANFASIGIQIGGIGSLVPERKALLSKLGIRALIAGTLACLFTAVIVGMLM